MSDCTPILEPRKIKINDIEYTIDRNLAVYFFALSGEIKTLTKQNEMLKEVVEFYGDTENWYIERFTKRDVETVISNHSGIDLQSDNGGKTARKALEEIGEI